MKILVIIFLVLLAIIMISSIIAKSQNSEISEVLTGLIYILTIVCGFVIMIVAVFSAMCGI